MYKIAVLGDRDSVLGFRALGLDTFFVEDTEEARHTLHRLARENYAIIYMTEALAGPLAADIDRYKSETTPAVILIPARASYRADRRLRRTVHAGGSGILSSIERLDAAPPGALCRPRPQRPAFH